MSYHLADMKKTIYIWYMKQKIYLLLFVTGPFIATAQQAKFKKDAFTGQEVGTTKYEPVSMKGKLNVYSKVSVVDDQYFLTLAFSNNRHFVVESGRNVALKLKDNSVLWLSVNNSIMTTVGGLKHGLLVGSGGLGINIAFALTEDQLKALSETDIVSIRLATNDGNIDVDLPDNRGDKIRNQVKAIYKKAP